MASSSIPAEAQFAQAIAHFNAEEYRDALLAFEQCWFAERSDFLRGLIQLAKLDAFVAVGGWAQYAPQAYRQAVALQKVADHFGKAIHVHCWLRPPKYNSQIGGAGNSAHLRGTATDFHFEGLTAEQVRKSLKDHPDLYPGTGENNVSWVHIDLEHHRWFNP